MHVSDIDLMEGRLYCPPACVLSLVDGKETRLLYVHTGIDVNHDKLTSNN